MYHCPTVIHSSFYSGCGKTGKQRAGTTFVGSEYQITPQERCFKKLLTSYVSRQVMIFFTQRIPFNISLLTLSFSVSDTMRSCLKINVFF
jgi:hypothetical protein